MTNFDMSRAEIKALQRTAGTLRPARAREGINRYLGAAAHPDPYAVTPEFAGIARAEPGVRNTRTTGVVTVGVDESPISCIAVDHAATEAELHCWALRLVTVQRTGADDTGPRLLRRLTDRVHAIARSTPVTSRLVIGTDPVEALLREAGDSDLLVVGHRHGATATALGRSVADNVARRHSGPVLVVRMPGWPAAAELGARPLVVGTDDSALSQAALAFALDEGRVRDGEVTMVHIGGDGTTPPYLWETRSGVPVHHRTVAGDPVEALVEASEKAAAVVIGRPGHGAPPEPLLSVAARVLPQRALCPVFLVG